MARASASNIPYDTIATYMDGVQVKIADKYKAPPQLVVPTAYYSKLPDPNKCTYDFSLEKTVIDKMKAWRIARSSCAEARRARIEDKRKQEAEKPPPPLSPGITATPEATILTPQPLNFSVSACQNHTQINGLDYSDFDNDTSSPFDNMELKTINDMEELAQVLQPTTSQWAPSPSLEAIMKDLTMDQNIEETSENKINNEGAAAAIATTNTVSTDFKNADDKQNMVALIMQDLQKELDRPNMEKRQPWPDLESPVTENTLHSCSDNSVISDKEIPRILSNLSDEEQTLAKRLSDMGFSLRRVARAICDLKGQDNKKIIEYLLAIQSLEDFGISEDAAVKALALTEYDQHKAKMYYESLCTLRDLGFPEDKASNALLKCNIDRDSALELLIS